MTRRPLAGIRRATAYARQYVWAYWLSGSVLLPIASLFLGHAALSGCVTALAWLMHLLSIVFVMPGAILLNFAVLRFFPSRTRHAESWRVTAGGILAAPAVWSGPFLLKHNWYRPPAELAAWFGSDWASIAQGIGMVMAASTLSLALAWALPPWPTPRGSRALK